MVTEDGPGVDAVRQRRARLARLASVGQSVGYTLIGVSIAVFVAGAAMGFTSFTTTLVTAALAGATLTLAPAIVLGYAVKAAEREDPGPGGQG